VKVVLDTSAVSAVMHRRPDALDRLEALKPSQVVLCSPVAAEIAFGLARLEPGSRRRVLLEEEYQRLRAVVEWADWGENAAQQFGLTKAAVYQAGTPVDDMDLVVASVALGLGAEVATANVKRFVVIPGLVVRDWH
jgi:tRNA(fMet)-specific endonuclease VapC